jgi:hypothetical protein
MWVRSTLEKSGFVAHAYFCPKCTFLQVAVEPDPLVKAAGWLKSELKPPEK